MTGAVQSVIKQAVVSHCARARDVLVSIEEIRGLLCLELHLTINIRWVCSRKKAFLLLRVKELIIVSLSISWPKVCFSGTMHTPSSRPVSFMEHVAYGVLIVMDIL